MKGYYLLIAHKPSSASYSRNCLMESYSSDFIQEDWLDREKLIEKLADLYYKNRNMKGCESGYDISIYRDAITVDGITRDEDEEGVLNGLSNTNTMEELSCIEVEAKAICDKRIEEETLARMQAFKIDKEKQEAERLKREKQEYERLKSKFETK